MANRDHQYLKAGDREAPGYTRDGMGALGNPVAQPTALASRQIAQNGQLQAAARYANGLDLETAQGDARIPVREAIADAEDGFVVSHRRARPGGRDLDAGGKHEADVERHVLRVGIP